MSTPFMNGAPLLQHRVAGEGPPLVLLNGGMMTFVAWEPIATRLRDGYRVLQLDFRGQLASPGTAPADLDGHAADVVALFDSLGWTSAHLVGTSFGAEVALALASRWPERARSLVVATAMDRESEEFRASREASHAMLAEIAAGGAREAFWDALTESIYSASYRESQAPTLAARRAQLGFLPASWFEGVDRLLDAMADFDLRDRLAAVRCPSLVVLAGDDRVMSEARSRALAAALRAEVRVHPTAGHAMVVEEPAWFVDVCLEFLARVDGATGG